jgi:hypothetical protein
MKEGGYHDGVQGARADADCGHDLLAAAATLLKFFRTALCARNSKRVGDDISDAGETDARAKFSAVLAVL